MTGLDVLAVHRGYHGSDVELAQPGLGMRALARPPHADRQAVGVQVMGDEGGTRLPHPRRVRFKPDLDLLQLDGQLLLRRRLALLPFAVLVPDCPPPA